MNSKNENEIKILVSVKIPDGMTAEDFAVILESSSFLSVFKEMYLEELENIHNKSNELPVMGIMKGKC